MNAVLTTRCGCKREIKVTFPPPPNIMIPLPPDRGILAVAPTAEMANPLQTREFRLEHRPVHPGDAAYYYETA